MAGWPYLGIRLDSERIDAIIDRGGKCGLQLQEFRVQNEPFERACKSALEPTGHGRHLVIWPLTRATIDMLDSQVGRASTILDTVVFVSPTGIPKRSAVWPETRID